MTSRPEADAPGYSIRLLGRVPMVFEQDTPETVATVTELAALLQRWFFGIGFDYRQTDLGGYFRVMIWDAHR